MAKKDENQSEWIELCEYVKREVLCYEDEMKFPKYLALRLRGLGNGKFIANKKSKPQASYDYKTILLTFKACKSKIAKYLHENQTKINDERHKINLVMMFVEQEINDISLRIKRSRKASDKVEQIDLNNQIHEGAEYQPKTITVDKKFENLW